MLLLSTLNCGTPLELLLSCLMLKGVGRLHGDGLMWTGHQVVGNVCLMRGGEMLARTDGQRALKGRSLTGAAAYFPGNTVIFPALASRWMIWAS